MNKRPVDIYAGEEPPDSRGEVRELRRRIKDDGVQVASKTFKVGAPGSGKRQTIIPTGGPRVHYKDRDGQIRSCRYRWQDEGNGVFACRWYDPEIEFHVDQLAFALKDKDGKELVRYRVVRIGDKSVRNLRLGTPVIEHLGGVDTQPSRGNRRLRIPIPELNVDVCAVLVGVCRFVFFVNDDRAPREMLLEVVGDIDGYATNNKPTGRDNVNDTAIDRSQYDKHRVLDISKTEPFVDTVRGKQRLRATLTWSGGVNKVVDPQTRQRVVSFDSDDVEYPVRMVARFDIDETATVQGTEDVANSTWNPSDTFMEWGDNVDNYAQAHVGLFLSGVAVGQGDTIDSAQYRTGTYDPAGSGTFGDAHMEDSDDAAAFGASARPSQKTATTASTAHAVADWTGSANDQTISLTSAVQEVVDRGGWVSGNDMAILLLARGSASFDGFWIPNTTTWVTTTPNPGHLEINFTAGGGSTAVKDMIGGGIVPFGR